MVRIFENNVVTSFVRLDIQNDLMFWKFRSISSMPLRILHVEIKKKCKWNGKKVNAAVFELFCYPPLLKGLRL